jgi:hypothetical protein
VKLQLGSGKTKKIKLTTEKTARFAFHMPEKPVLDYFN